MSFILDSGGKTRNLSLKGPVRTIFWLEPKTGMDPGPQSLNNKFVESGIKS